MRAEGKEGVVNFGGLIGLAQGKIRSLDRDGYSRLRERWHMVMLVP